MGVKARRARVPFSALVFCLCQACAVSFAMPDEVRGVYLNPQSFGQHKVADTIYYALHAEMNAVVLHVKDPVGYVHWVSRNELATQLGAVKGTGRFEKALEAFKQNGMWTIAKMDVFQDTLLAENRPDLAVLDSKTNALWRDKKGLCWANPYDREVWNYAIALAKELAGLGIAEVQFDYVRFPSDGDLSRLRYPKVLEGKSQTETIGAFLEAAYATLHPLGVAISVDVFGLVAWKKDDFGVGQRIEDIAPYVDVICPMLYPSHFPSGFLGKKDPGAFPKEIMERSTTRLLARTQTKVRPWIQGFWYAPDEIIAQLDGVTGAGAKSWTVWNPASNYESTYKALAKWLGRPIPARTLHADLEALTTREPLVVRGVEQVVNYTDYQRGCSMLRLEAPKEGTASPYGTLGAVVGTLDDAVAERIVEQRGKTPSENKTAWNRTEALVKLVCADLNVAATRMRPCPVYVDWRNDCRFTAQPPDKWENPAAPVTPSP